jgi:formylglycine-generating enzyme required for sulfatase activity
MAWPSTTEYNDAIQNLRTSVSDEELRAGELARTSRGLPMLWSGNFADVYRVHCAQTGSTWAVKCFTRESPGLKERYREISAHLEQARLPFMVDFEFVEPGIRVGGQWHPFLKMRWVEGLALNQFLSEYVENRPTLEQLLPMWTRLSQMLREAEIAHCDLQHGNVLLVPAGDRGQLSLKLIDYDGMYVPSLGGRRPGELGHPAYQHPQRLRERIYNKEVDRFSHLAIYCAVRCLTVGKRKLWTRFDNGDNLLFREVDFQSPGEAQVFRELWALDDEDARALAGHLILATQMPLDRVSLLTEVASNGTVRRLTREQEQRVERLLGCEASGVRIVPSLVTRERSPAFGAEPSAHQRGTPPAGSPGSGASQGPWWVSGQPAAGEAQALPLPSLTHRVKPTPSTSAQPVSTARREILVDLGRRVRIAMVLIPAGEFMMGSADSDTDASSNEKPQHRVRINEPFYLGKHEVTQEQWQRVMGTNPSSFRGPRNPVEEVRWEDCEAFLEKLNQQFGTAGATFRLPTEAEWEYSCRAGSTTSWCFGDDEASLREYAWHAANSAHKTHPVGQKRPNAWGLYEMHGNVSEWCADWYQDEYYGESLPDDPQGPASGSYRVLRGGSWLDLAGVSRSASRGWGWPALHNQCLGFRVARTL